MLHKRMLSVAVSVTLFSMPLISQAASFPNIDTSHMDETHILQVEKVAKIKYQKALKIEQIQEAKRKAEEEAKQKAIGEQKALEEQQRKEEQSNKYPTDPQGMAQWENNNFADVHERANFLNGNYEYTSVWNNWNDDDTLLYLQTLNDYLQTSGELQTETMLSGEMQAMEESYTE